MPSIATWKKLQAASGLVFGCFLVMHLASHYSLSLGWERANETLLKARSIYQRPVFEVTLVIATLVHMMSNTVIIMKRGKIDASKKKDGSGKKQPAGTTELTGHRWAGYFLSIFILGHAGATRLAPLLILDDPSQYDYSFVTKVNELVPLNLFAIYLVLLGMAGGWHLIYGTRSALATLAGSSVTGKPFPMVLKPVALLSHILIISAVLAVTGYYYVIDVTTKAELHDQINSKLGIH